MRKAALSSLVIATIATIATISPAMAQATIMIAAYEMICTPENPVLGPDGSAHEYAAYRVSWDGQNTVIVALAGRDGGNVARVQRASKTVAVLQAGVGANAYSVRLDFGRGRAAYNYGRIDRCDKS